MYTKRTLYFLLIFLIIEFHYSEIKATFFSSFNNYLSFVAHKLTQHPLTWFCDNFHEVEKGKLYRSKTLSSHSLERYIKEYGFHSILILRKPENAEWYFNEIALAKQHNLLVHCVPLETKLPSKEQIKEIVSIFSSTPLPLLIHCEAGADRSGMISGLWVLEKMNGTLQEALEQLSHRHAHIEWINPAMKHFIRIWHSLKQSNKASLDEYNPEDYPTLPSLNERIGYYLSYLRR